MVSISQTLGLCLIALANFFLGYVVYKRQPANILNRVFLTFTLSVVFWLVANFLADADKTHAVLWINLTYLGSTLISIFLIYFSIIFPKIPTRISPFLHLSILGVSGVVIWLVIFSKLVVLGLIFRSWGTDIEPGVLYVIYPLYFLTFSIISLVNLWRKYRSSLGIEKTQIFYVFLGLLLSVTTGFFTNSLSYYFIGDYRLAKYGPYSTIFVVAFMAYAIVAHRLFDIRVIIKRTVIFAGLSGFVLGTYALIIFLSAALLGGQGGQAFEAKTLIPNFVSAVGIAIGFEPLRRWLTRTTDQWLFKGEYVAQDVLRELSETLANVLDLSEAVEEMMQIITKAMRLTKSAAFLLQPGENKDDLELKQVVTVGMRSDQGMQLAPKDSLIEYYRSSQISHDGLKPVVVEELQRQLADHALSAGRKKLTEDFVARLSKIGGAVSLPLFIKRQQPIPTPPGSPPRMHEVDTFIGILVLGEKKSGDAFSDQDLNLLQIVASQTAGAVEKSRLFEEDQLKSEFVAVASHELLTPTAAMEGYLSMILDEGMGKVDKQARTYLTTVYTEAKRLAGLVKDLLNVSRIERGKIVVNSHPMDIMEAIHQVENSLVFKAKERKMHLEVAEPKPKLPNVMADNEKITEVLVNLVGNSIKYTPEGGHIWISTELRGTQVIVHVKDDGIGMKPEDAQHLFSKFFRASNSDQTGQTGTGLGLYITKNIIELMGGTIGCESALSKGSTFTFSLPVAK